PDIRPRYLSDGRDIRAIVDGARLLARLAAAAPLRDVTEASIGPAPEAMNDERIVDDFRRRADTVFHPVGTCAMGRDPARSVVDPKLRVHGVDALRVVDASVFPNVTSGNTNAPTMMVARIAAAAILHDAAGSRPSPRLRK
ncbi:MAG: choline dehydrogenase, partial [Proteobacteria bacterium]